MKIRKQTQTRTATYIYELNSGDIKQLFRKDIRKYIKRIYINIPTGGDYSGMDLDIDIDCPIIVEMIKEKQI